MPAQLHFEVKNQIISRADKFVPASDSKNYLTAHFSFLTDEWSGTVTAVFTKDDTAYEVILDENNECLVPWELLTEAGIVYVSCFCGDLVTATKSRINVLKSGWVENGENTNPPTPNIYDQIITMLDNFEGDIVSRFAAFKEEIQNDLSTIDGGSFTD